MSGSVFDYILTGLLWFAAMLQFAAIRDRTIYDTHRGEAYRWLLCAASVGLAFRFSFEMLDLGTLTVPWHSQVSLTLLAMGLIGTAAEQLFRRPIEGKAPHRRSSDWVPMSARGEMTEVQETRRHPEVQGK